MITAKKNHKPMTKYFSCVTRADSEGMVSPFITISPLNLSATSRTSHTPPRNNRKSIMPAFRRLKRSLMKKLLRGFSPFDTVLVSTACSSEKDSSLKLSVFPIN